MNIKYSRPSVQVQGPHFGDVRTQVAVHSGAFDAHEYAQIQAGPIGIRGIAVGTLPVAEYPSTNVLHVFRRVMGRTEFPANVHFVDLKALRRNVKKKKTLIYIQNVPRDFRQKL